MRHVMFRSLFITREAPTVGLYIKTGDLVLMQSCLRGRGTTAHSSYSGERSMNEKLFEMQNYSRF